MIARRGSGWLASTLLLGVCVALAAFVTVQVQMETPGLAPSGSGEAPPLAVLPAQHSYAMAPVEDFTSILERPLFSPSRRPPAEGVVATAAPELGLQVTLVGVIISSEEQIAIVRLEDATSFARLSVGDNFQGWTLDSIEPNRPMCASPTLVKTAKFGSAIRVSRLNSPRVFMPISTTARVCRASSRSNVCGSPIRLLKFPFEISVFGFGAKTLAAISLVVVLPALPATHTTLGSIFRRQARAMSPYA